jgi:hypothetical protein
MPLNDDQSLLLELPAELRNMIYHYVLDGESIYAYSITRGKTYLGLLLSCRQIYQETELLLYSVSIFPIDFGDLGDWLSDRTDRQLAVISSIWVCDKVNLQRATRVLGYYTWPTVDPKSPSYTRLKRLPALKQLLFQFEKTAWSMKHHVHHGDRDELSLSAFRSRIVSILARWKTKLPGVEIEVTLGYRAIKWPV